jgi:hypothetical protein
LSIDAVYQISLESEMVGWTPLDDLVWNDSTGNSEREVSCTWRGREDRNWSCLGLLVGYWDDAGKLPVSGQGGTEITGAGSFPEDSRDT